MQLLECASLQSTNNSLSIRLDVSNYNRSQSKGSVLRTRGWLIASKDVKYLISPACHMKLSVRSLVS